jgi:hypothetical protein
MRMKSTLAVIGLLAGVTAVAAADRQPAPQAGVMPVHVMSVRMPDGSVQQIHYVGDVAPHVVVQPVAAMDPMLAAFGPDSPFAMMDRISAQIDAQMAGMMQQTATMQRMTPAQLQQTAMASAPNGATSFTMISTTNGNGVTCSQSVRSVSMGDGKAPQVIRTASDGCGKPGMDQAKAPTLTSAPAAQAPKIIPAVLPAKAPATPKPDPSSI